MVDKPIETIEDAVDNVSKRCKPVAQRRADVEHEIHKATIEKKKLERIVYEDVAIKPVVSGLLSSPVLSDFLSNTIKSLQQEYAMDYAAYKTALALIRDECCSIIVARYNTAIDTT